MTQIEGEEKKRKGKKLSLASDGFHGGTLQKAVKSWRSKTERGLHISIYRLEDEDETTVTSFWGKKKFISRIASQRPFARLVKLNRRRILLQFYL